METEFSKIITLLRKEKKLSQKRVARELNISQGLLSHYEKGVRECGLDFIIRIAEYYEVSCDYLLGRTTDRNPNIPKEPEKPDDNRNSITRFNQELINNAISLLFELAQQTENRNTEIILSDYLMASVYKLFRMICSANPENPQTMFHIPNELYQGYTTALQNIKETEWQASLKGISVNGTTAVVQEKLPEISEDILLSKYEQYANSIVNIVKITENNLKR